jgi:hypothetical protein
MPVNKNIKEQRKAIIRTVSDARRIELINRRVKERLPRNFKLAAKMGLEHRAELFSLIREIAGNLKGKKVLVLAEDSVVKEYLKKTECASATIYNERLQNLGQNLSGKKFGLIVANWVFEHHAFEYSSGEKIGFFTRKIHTSKNRSERQKVLLDLSNLVEKNGLIILSAISGPLIFSPQEITRAGLKIKQLNRPTKLDQKLTVLEKV